MKWIGENIRDYVSRFRNDVYIEKANLNIYDDVIDGNPTINLGSAAADRLEIKSVYNSTAKTLCDIDFTTYTTSSTANDGRFNFYVDEVLLGTINDGGLYMFGNLQSKVDGATLTAINTTTSSATEGGTLRLMADDDVAMGDDHRLGVIEFYGAEDTNNNRTIGARIEAMADAAWSASENGGRLDFYTTDADASESKVLTLNSDKRAAFMGDVTVASNLVVDSVTVSAIQTSEESFVDNDTSLMTSAAVDDRIAVTAAALITAEDLDLTADSGTAAVDLNSQALAVTGGTNITTSATGQAVTVNVDDAFLKNDASDSTTGTITSNGLIVSGSKNIEGNGDGAMIHLDAGGQTITDTDTAGSGTVAKYTHVNIEPGRLAATNASVTTTNAATLYISGAPSAHTNQTITNPYALWVNAGVAKFDGGITGDLTGSVVTAAQGNITSLGTLTSLAVTGASDLGSAAMTLTSQDVDKIALDINASNTTANILDINAQALTSGKAIYVDCNSMVHGSTSIHFDFDENSTTSIQNTLQFIDYNRTGNLASVESNHTTGLNISMNDLATGNHATSTSRLTALDINLDHANADALSYQTGIDLTLTDADVSHATVTSIGLLSTVENGGFDIKMQSSTTAGDNCTIATGEDGATTITTTDAAAAAAHFEIAADGDIILDAAGTIKLEGPVRPTGQLQTTYYMFRDGLDDTKHYVGLQEADAESGTASNKNLPILAPVAGKLLKVFLRATNDLSARTFTWRLETHDSSSSTGGTPTVIGTVAGTGCTASSMTTYDFTAVTNTIDAGDTVQLSIQSDDTAATTTYYITCLWEWDFSSIG